MIYLKKSISMLFFSLIILLIANVNALQQTSPVQRFSDGSVVDRAFSILKTTDRGASFNLHTSELPPHSAVTIWWVVFNHPEHCSHGVLGLRCGEGDLSAPEVDASVLYATGHVIGFEGKGSFNDVLKVNETAGALFGPGLTNPKGADIHLVVHSHGTIIPGLTREMTHTFGGGCNNTPPGTGTPGPNTCVDLQFSAHEQ